MGMIDFFASRMDDTAAKHWLIDLDLVLQPHILFEHCECFLLKHLVLFQDRARSQSLDKGHIQEPQIFERQNHGFSQINPTPAF